MMWLIFSILLIIVIYYIILDTSDKINENVKNLNKPLSTYEKLPKILYLILYNENLDHENEMKRVLDRYVNNFSHVKTYFVAFKKLNNKEYEINGNTIYFNGIESYIPGVLDKTIKTIRLLTTNLTYDYLVRSNISTVIDLTKLTNLLANIKNTNIYATGWTLVGCKKCGPKNFLLSYASGTSIILDKVSAKYLLDNADKLRYDIIDDMSIGLLMKSNKGVKIYEFPGFKFNKINNIKLLYNYVNSPKLILDSDPYAFKNIIFYRNKTKNRYHDIIKMNNFVNYLLDDTYFSTK